jgi:2,4-dienoyl-CoA reductase-like NADH-dependent reductase (Old Yellow Enzyme family)
VPDPHLFQPITLRSVTARNRIVVSPMCQYSAVDGVPQDWHLANLAARAVGGAGIVFTEVAHLEPRGRITPWCLGLWNDAQEAELARIARFIASQGAVPAIQVGHAGRKGSTNRPWEGSKPMSVADGGFAVIGPTDRPWAEGYPVPTAMDDAAIATVLAAFADAARRARRAGFKVFEIHGAHGYLIHEFLSPLVNTRADAYGGDAGKRRRFLMEAIDAVRREWPADLPLFVRLSCVDHVPGGLAIDDTVELCRQLQARGDVDLVDCSSGGADPRQQIAFFPGYQVPYADAIRNRAGIATGAVGLIQSPHQAEEVLANGRADLVFMGRTLLADPHWPLKAAKALGAGGRSPRGTAAPSAARHYFVDEAGDPTLFNRKGELIFGRDGCSRYFILGCLEVADPGSLGLALEALQKDLLADPFLQRIPSMLPASRKTALAFHAKDDVPEVRHQVFHLLMQHDVRFYAVVRDKRALAEVVIERNRQDAAYRYNENDVYDGLIARPFRDRLHKANAHAVTFARRGQSDRTAALRQALLRARRNFEMRWGIAHDGPLSVEATIMANAPPLQAADYFLWSLQRFFERGEDRYLTAVWTKIGLVVDMDDRRRAAYGEYYNRRKPLTADAAKGRKPEI